MTRYEWVPSWVELPTAPLGGRFRRVVGEGVVATPTDLAFVGMEEVGG